MPSKQILKFKSLNCYNCADKIKKEILKISYVSDVKIDVLNQKLELEINDTSDLNEKIDYIKDICIKIEPEMSFVDTIIEDKTLAKYINFSIGLILFLVSFIPNISQTYAFFLCIVSYVIIGKDIFRKGFGNIKNKILFDENFLMIIATIGAFVIGEFREAIAVIVFYEIGEFIQNGAINKSRSSISKLMDIKPEIANLEFENSVVTVHPSKVKIGDIIIVKPGEKIPLDGVIISGESSLDTRALTGESLPKEVTINDSVLSGCINIDSMIKIKVRSEFKDSAVLKILNLVENAHSRKSKAENFITKFSQVYTPIVILTALIVAIFPPLFIPNQLFSEWIYKSLIFLVISCPCALVISIPLSFFSGIGVCSKNGILVKGSSYLESLNNISAIVFDKTGTLTEGVFSVTKINNINCTKYELIEIAAIAESFSNHPIAKSIIDFHNKKIDKSKILKHEEIPGHGIVIDLENDIIIVGNRKIMDKFNITVSEIHEFIGTKVYVAKNNIYMGDILISDKVKPNSQKTISELKAFGIKNITMLSGDSINVVKSLCDKIGIDNFHAELLPNQKVECIEKFSKSKRPKSNLAFVGDGINDAPSLAIADIGISMGKFGTDAAIEASDIVLIDDDPFKIVTAINIANQTRKIALQNIAISLGIKILILILAVLGITSIWAAILSDVGASVIVILNSIKILTKKHKAI